jgi:hypothetical protein
MVATKFRKKPVEIQAMRYVHERPQDAAPVLSWIRSGGGSADFDPASGAVLIITLEGLMSARSGDWIIRGVQGEFYPCKPGIFDATYEPVHQVTHGVTVTEGERVVPLSEYLGR